MSSPQEGRGAKHEGFVNYLVIPSPLEKSERIRLAADEAGRPTPESLKAGSGILSRGMSLLLR